VVVAVVVVVVSATFFPTADTEQPYSYVCIYVYVLYILVRIDSSMWHLPCYSDEERRLGLQIRINVARSFPGPSPTTEPTPTDNGLEGRSEVDVDVDVDVDVVVVVWTRGVVVVVVVVFLMAALTEGRLAFLESFFVVVEDFVVFFIIINDLVVGTTWRGSLKGGDKNDDGQG
jgi:hypothetical protein